MNYLPFLSLGLILMSACTQEVEELTKPAEQTIKNQLRQPQIAILAQN